MALVSISTKRPGPAIEMYSSQWPIMWPHKDALLSLIKKTVCDMIRSTVPFEGTSDTQYDARYCTYPIHLQP